MNKTYACSDLHGMYNLWAQIRDYCDETDKIIFLGDAADRGKDGLKIIQELLADKRVTYLKGNHEDMFAICVPAFSEGHFDNMPWWYANGGKATYDTVMELSYETQLYLARKLDKLPRSIWYESPLGHKIFLTHAGTDLHYTEEQLAMYFGRKDAYLWDRKHIGCGRPSGKEYEKVFQVHGHTPVVNDRFAYFGIPRKIETLFYDDHKYCIDMGAFATYKTALIDLDTFETKYFYDEISMKESIYE